MKSFVVIGCGRFGSSVAKNLYELGNEVMIVDRSEELINDIADHVTHAIEADVTDENVLEALGLSNFDVAIVAIASSLEASVMATIACKDLGVPKVIAKAQSARHSRILEKLGADKVIFPEQDMGLKLAHNLNSTNILDFIEFSPDYNIVELIAAKEWNGKTLEELSLPNRHAITVLAIRRDEAIRLVPRRDDKILRGDILVVIGSNEDIEKLEGEMTEG